MVWFHGGGWFAGTGNSFVYGPQALLDREIVLVTLNYRLGALGESIYKFPILYNRIVSHIAH